MYHSLLRFTLLLFAVFSFAAVPETAAVPNSRTANAPIGSNLDVVADWTTEIPFIDVFKLSRPWIPTSAQLADTGEYDALQLDASGWVTALPQASDRSTQYSAVQTVIFSKSGANYPGGLYTVHYDGKGTILYGGDAHKREELSTDGKDIVELFPGTTDAGIVIKITETDPADYIRNIQMLLPGFSAEQAQNDIFYPPFLASIDQFSVIRMLNWLRVNYTIDWQSTATTRSEPSLELNHPLDQLAYDPDLRQSNWNEPLLWAERPLPTDARYSTEQGVPLEIMAALINRLDADIWINLPHQVSSYYVWEYAKLMQDQLAPDKQVYFEYSNEIWNTGFGQGEYVQQQAVQAGVVAANGYEARLKWYAAQSADLCNVWKQTWGAANEHRVSCLINAPAAQPDKITTMLACDHWIHQPCSNHLDAVAIAPYFGQYVGQPEHLATVRQWSTWGESGLDHLFQELRFGNKLPALGNIAPAALPDVYHNISTAFETVSQYVNGNNEPIALIAYEGGQHLVGLEWAQSDPQLNAFFAEFNRNWRMKQLYAEYLPQWHALGGGTFVHYKTTSAYSEWGYWGAQEYIQQPNAGKAVAITTYIETFEEPVLTERLFLPVLNGGNVPANAAPFHVPMPEAERAAQRLP